MNKNCIILEIFTAKHQLDADEVFPVLYDYDGPCQLYTEEEAAAEVDRLIKQRASSWAVVNGVNVTPGPRYQVVTILP